MMPGILLALATLSAISVPNIQPITVNFTSDSVYKHDSIITPTKVQEQEDSLYTIFLEEDKLLGYCIYDNPETPYIDGLKFDDEFVTNYIVPDVDFNIEHNILIKTVYTDDIAGMFAAAKNGDWSRALSNPLILLQIFYYILAAVSIILGGFGIFKSRKKKILDHNEIASAVDVRAANATEALTGLASDLVAGIVNPVFEKLRNQNQKIIEAMILQQSGDKASKLALIDLLKDTANEDVSDISSSIIKSVEEYSAIRQKAKLEANKIVQEIASGNFENKEKENNIDDGTTI